LKALGRNGDVPAGARAWIHLDHDTGEGRTDLEQT